MLVKPCATDRPRTALDIFFDYFSGASGLTSEIEKAVQVSSKAVGAIADRYATALFELAEQDSLLDGVAADLRALAGLVVQNDDLRRLLRSPVLSRTEQRKALVAVATRAGFNEITGNFLGVLAVNRRLFALKAITEAFLDRLATHRGEVTAHVAAAVPLSQNQLGALGSTLKKFVGRDVSLDIVVDPGLLGGLVVKVGSRMVDGSLKTKLQHLQLAMKGIG
jgi:F-type H+-transporting ATPase subunit delta